MNVVLSGRCKPHGKSHGRELHVHVGCSNIQVLHTLLTLQGSFLVFFLQCLLRSSWVLLNCSSFIFISYKGNSASFPIFQFLIAKNAHRLSRLLDLSYRIAQFLPTNDMLHPRPFLRIFNLRSVLSMSVSNSEPLWTIMHLCCRHLEEIASIVARITHVYEATPAQPTQCTKRNFDPL